MEKNKVRTKAAAKLLASVTVIIREAGIRPSYAVRAGYVVLIKL